MENLTFAAFIALLVATVVKEVASYFKAKALIKDETRIKAIEDNYKTFQETLTTVKTKVESVAKYTEEMHEWHDKSDEDGVKIWYIRKSLENVLRENAQATAVLAKNSELQTSLLKELIESQRTIMKEQMLLSNELKLHHKSRD